MKGLILGGRQGRYVEKDSYDLCSVVEYFEEGPRSVAAAVKPFVGEPLMGAAIGRMAEWFASEKAPGPRLVADFFPLEQGETRQRRITRAHAVVALFLEAVG